MVQHTTWSSHHREIILSLYISLTFKSIDMFFLSVRAETDSNGKVFSVFKKTIRSREKLYLFKTLNYKIQMQNVNIGSNGYLN